MTVCLEAKTVGKCQRKTCASLGMGAFHLKGGGGDSGSIARGGDGGTGGTVVITTTGNVSGGEAITVQGGNAVTQVYAPRTGKGGDGTAKGGDSGDIFNAGNGGGGGKVVITAGGNTDLDHVFAIGGVAGNNIFAIATYKTPMEAQTGLSRGGNGTGDRRGTARHDRGNAILRGGKGGEDCLERDWIDQHICWLLRVWRLGRRSEQ